MLDKPPYKANPLVRYNCAYYKYCLAFDMCLLYNRPCVNTMGMYGVKDEDAVGCADFLSRDDIPRKGKR